MTIGEASKKLNFIMINKISDNTKTNLIDTPTASCTILDFARMRNRFAFNG